MTTPAAVVTLGRLGGSDIECQVLRASIQHGRDDPTTQPIASTAVLELVGELPPDAIIGARVQLDADLDGVRVPRFVGEVTDLGVSWDDVDVPTPRIIATGYIGRIGRRVIGAEPWPQELDGVRAARILDLAGFPPDPLLSDPGTLDVLARDVDRQPALGLAHEVAEDAGGVLWQDRLGRIRYADADHRRGVDVGLEVQACDIGIGLEWAQTLEGLTNDVTLRYGPAPGGSAQPEVYAQDAESIAALGTFAVSLSTAIATEPDALTRANRIVARRADPVWTLGGLELDLELLDAAQTLAALELDVHGLLSVTGLPLTSPAPSAVLWVEGWRELIDPAGWVIAYATSDYCATGSAPRWDDVPAALTWDTVAPAMTWDDAACMPPPPSRGRWNDVPASIRWQTVPPDATWDTWPY